MQDCNCEEVLNNIKLCYLLQSALSSCLLSRLQVWFQTQTPKLLDGGLGLEFRSSVLCSVLRLPCDRGRSPALDVPVRPDIPALSSASAPAASASSFLAPSNVNFKGTSSAPLRPPGHLPAFTRRSYIENGPFSSTPKQTASVSTGMLFFMIRLSLGCGVCARA